jgi:membrane peptidoglycan carboxypeptidase
LAQRLVSYLVLDTELPSLWRNIRERILAAQITAHFGREKVMEWFLNSAKYGEYLYGADAAARAYFGKSATKLTLAEAAMLTAISETPSINPLTGSLILKARQDKIIQRMLVDGSIRADEALIAIREDVHFQTQAVTDQIAPEFTSLVLLQLGSVLPLERLARGGYDIITTLDYDLQMEAACASEVQIARTRESSEQAVTSINPLCDAARLLPTLKTEPEKPPQDLNVSVVIVEPHSGQILALVGDDSNGMAPNSPSDHPAGTIVSPFLYLTGFTRGISPATLLWDIPQNNGMDGSEAQLGNQPSDIPVQYHGPVRLRTAFVNDYLAAADTVLQQVGVKNVWLTLKRFGIPLPVIDPAEFKVANDIYSQSVNLVDIVQAYAVLANQGIMTGRPISNGAPESDGDSIQPTSILRVLDADGIVWLDWSTPHSRSIVSSQLAYLTTDVLRDEYARWPSLGHPNALEIGRPVGAKVGISINGKSTWTVGFLPQLVIGVWVGHSQEGSGRISEEIPAGLWHAIIQFASKQMPVQDFNLPEGVNRVQVCDPSGLLVSELCPSIVQEVFLTGNEPTQVDDLYQKFYINRETGLLATVFTPLEMVEEKVYIVLPPKAVSWAEEAGLPIPPDTYDVIYATLNASQDARIASPEIFDHVGGKITISGSAAGDGFSFFRLQVGKGLYPQQWIQIGEDIDYPVDDGVLGTWDTEDQEGLYVIQLLVVRQDQRIDRAISQVTIDNTNPQVEIIAPLEGESFDILEGEKLQMWVTASDNLELKRVEFHIDGQQQSVLGKPPFIILWPAQLGEHTLMVKAYDLAENSSEASVSFSVLKK